MDSLSPLFYFAPLWLLFELGQLVIGERYLGIKQIERGTDPRERGPGELVAFLWSAGLLLYWVWMALMLSQPIGRPQVAAMLGLSVLGFSIRSVCGLKWVLVTMTFEGAIRIGMLLSLGMVAWRRL
ncbi:hypothetical protein CMV30_05505 [Nibricoccus aquaticus]|uniref:Uncharacterized protein n=1 Tax=Nibricoccus aquaticus TaxID=2576891 RepID=A0A290QGJ1_9BACT|nr:hypothetical protein [Nibricoccus aquaticus]ATC63451.1 hypothetical protein CMV30_05505 [Nibricoccus aquaticus]